MRQSLEKFHNFDETQIEILNGKQLHKDIYSLILKHDVIKVKHEGIEALVAGHPILYRWPTNPETPPNYKQAIESAVKEREPLSDIGLNVNFLSMIGKILKPFEGQVELKFTKHNKAIFVNDQMIAIKYNFALIMPVMTNGFQEENNLNTIL